MGKGSALLIEDVQNDFCAGGSLAVPGGDEVVPVLNQYIDLFVKRGLPVFASRDWHPEDSRHFMEGGGIWPAHCVQGSLGARFHADLGLPGDVIVISKGTGIDEDGFSTFDGIATDGRDFMECLRDMGINHLYVGGLATDYCVKYTVLEALRRRFRVTLLLDAVRGVNLSPGDAEKAIREMSGAGAVTASLKNLKT